jgi:heat shock protein HslJ
VIARTRLATFLAPLALAALTLAAPVGAQSMAPTDGPPLEDTTWQVTAVAGAADPAAVAGMHADLLLSGGSASGNGGCNRFTTSYVLDGDQLTFQVPASTKMACDDASMAFESVYLGALPQTASYTISGTTLELLDQAGASVVTLTAGSGPGASGVPSSVVGDWTVTQLNNGNQGVETVPETPVLTVTFAADGSVAGFGGCNQFGGPYVLGGDTIGIGPLNSTMMACGDPADTLERQLLAALQASTAWSLQGDQLELRDDSGALQVGLVAGAPAPAAS